MSGPLPPFHLALPVHDLAAARRFYGGLLGCDEGRSAARWVDYDFFGHQLSLHLLDGAEPTAGSSPVDGDQVPIPHFGAVLAWADWQSLAARLREAGTAFIIAPRVRFEGQAGEQATMFLQDPSGNHLEFKSFQDAASLFATS